MKNLLGKLLFLFILSSLSLFAKTIINSEMILESDDVIWGMDFIDEDNLIFTEKSGSIKILNLKSKKLKEIKHNLNIFNVEQGGLLDIKLSPFYKDDKKFYLTYSKRVLDQGATTLIEATIVDNKLIVTNELLQTKSLSNKGHHFGSRITFDKNAHIYFGIGDRGFRDNAQNLLNHAGSIIRLNLDGTIPKDNPFINKEFALKEIYSYGHRNPQGLFYDKKRDILFEIEHGPRGGDEINIIEKAKNYGWPVISHGKEYWSNEAVGESTHKKGMEQAIMIYIPSIAPSSLIVYQGEKFKSLKGKILSTALKLRHLNIITLDESLKVIDEQRVLTKLNERFRNIVESPNGELFISTDSGKIFKLTN